MPWTTDNPPAAAKNWTEEEIEKCVKAANAVLDETGNEEQAIFACIRAAGRSERNMEYQFLFTELNADALTDGRPFDGVAFGTFRDMLGREITLEADDAADYVENTRLAIEATRTESGDLVGLPIDAQGHEKGDGAGWIVGVELVNGIIRLVPKWTKIGRELIGEGIRRFFSATIDVSNKVVLGGTLTNWPATRDENNRMMLRPIELEQGSDAPLDISQEAIMPEEIKEQQEEPEVVETQPATPPPAEIRPDEMAELIKQFSAAGQQEPYQMAQAVQQQANAIAQNLVDRLMQERAQNWEITQLAAKLTGGGPFGLPVSVVELTGFLQSLDADQFAIAKKLFETISQSGVIDFEERGHSRRMRRKPLPEVYHAQLKRTLAAGNTFADFFDAMPELSSPQDYDLSEFEGGK